jgi:NAD+ synthetase
MFNIGLLQLNFTIGDIAGNLEKILDGYHSACDQGAKLVVGSELALYGYPPLDLLERREFRDAQNEALLELCRHIGDVGLILGVSVPNHDRGKPIFNAAVLIRNGEIQQQRHKALLPTYDVFDEARYFEPGHDPATVFDYDGKQISMLVCEDIWGGAEFLDTPSLYETDPLAELEPQSPDILIVPNGSPYYYGKGADRLTLVRRVAKRLNTTLVYVHQVGGNTDLVSDGRSFVLQPNGDCISALPPFEEAVGVVDVDSADAVEYPNEKDLTDLNQALVLGVRDYARKTGHSQAALGLSGGIDSAVTACIAVEALGADQVTGFIMPSEFSSDHSIEDAQQLADNLGIKAHQISITDAYKTFGQTLDPVIEWGEPGRSPGDVTEENVQARIRGILLMAFANRHPGTLLLSTGNKSEVAMGYCTLYGDMAGGFAVLADVWKTWVFQLAEFINTEREIIPTNTIKKPPSAELRPDEKDSDSLPPYEILDAVLSAYLEDRLAPDDIIKRGLADADSITSIISAVHKNEFKRRQMPPGPKVTSKAFGTGRRMPIASRLKIF